MSEAKLPKNEPTVADKLLKPYDPLATENRIYDAWEVSGFFNPDNLEKADQGHKDPFTIIMPPPNANGNLHAGHALFITLEDLIIRFKRMQGHKTLWVPGADHAGFETQIVYEKKLEKEDRSRFKMDPQDLYKEIYDFTVLNKQNMEAQVRSLGASCDWSRERFTLDPEVIVEVQKTFKKMFDDGLVYRGNRMVNWCTKHQTSLSDVETESREKTDTMYYIKYGPLTVATVRPETMFGDVAVAVNPKDKRYKKLIGQKIEVTIPEKTLELEVVGDESVDMEFGTGALKITPSHDKNDFEVASRHNLPHNEVIDKFGKLNEKTGKYAGMKIADARREVVKDLEAMGLIEKTEEYVHQVPVCYKCENTIEPRAMPQWFVRMQPLAKMALQAAIDNKLTFYPDNYKKIFTYWMENSIDWNISRQIIWGIPIPAKICPKCGEGFPDLENKLHRCPKCDNEMLQDPDTFDTWFSSGQWPLITLGFPNDPDFKTFYPTSVMETGYDLIFKWVPRMVIFGLYLAKEVPFKDIYLHGLVNDAQGKKMSKSKGNVVNPLDLTQKYGTDALRMALVVGNPAGSDSALSENKVKGYRNFSNKLWNITRFILSNTGELPLDRNFGDHTDADKVLKHELSTLLEEVTADLESYRFHLASEKLYHYVWHTLADKILEESKVIFESGTDAEKLSRKQLLLSLLERSTRALHPFMPFITEELWTLLPIEDKKLLLVETWPK